MAFAVGMSVVLRCCGATPVRSTVALVCLGPFGVSVGGGEGQGREGGEAIAESAIRAGCMHYFGYPITPQTEIAAYMAKRMPKIGGVFLQAESEIAVINMVLGVAATGKRVMTSSSSPGISLKSEGLSYLAGSDLPALVVNVQRGGPGLGGIQPSQSDYWQSTGRLHSMASLTSSIICPIFISTEIKE